MATILTYLLIEYANLPLRPYQYIINYLVSYKVRVSVAHKIANCVSIPALFMWWYYHCKLLMWFIRSIV